MSPVSVVEKQVPASPPRTTEGSPPGPGQGVGPVIPRRFPSQHGLRTRSASWRPARNRGELQALGSRPLLVRASSAGSRVAEARLDRVAVGRAETVRRHRPSGPPCSVGCLLLLWERTPEGRLAPGTIRNSVKVFLSSVIRGLERERDAAARSAERVGHEVRRSEDFGASPQAPQDACLAGVRWSDDTSPLMPWSSWRSALRSNRQKGCCLGTVTGPRSRCASWSWRAAQTLTE
jgi:hypothetical protein